MTIPCSVPHIPRERPTPSLSVPTYLYLLTCRPHEIQRHWLNEFVLSYNLNKDGRDEDVIITSKERYPRQRHIVKQREQAACVRVCEQVHLLLTRNV